MTSLAGSANPADRPVIFVSYPSIDDKPPPDRPKNPGFVRKFHELLAYELTQRGMREGAIWRDRQKIAHADNWKDRISDALAQSALILVVVSPHFLRSDECIWEIETFAAHLKDLSEHERSGRIFRVDKSEVPDQQLPLPLQRVHAARFFERDPETGMEIIYYDGRRIVRQSKYIQEIQMLAASIYKRLKELGLVNTTVQPPPPLPLPSPRKLCVYLAKPASDMNDEYQTVVRELRGHGYGVVPDPEQDLPNDGAVATGIIRAALARATLSIHLVGEKRGFKPDGIDDGIVGFQLTEAKLKSGRDEPFSRLIWIPKFLRQPDGQSSSPRDPMDVLNRFGQSLGSQDEIDGDVASRFNEFVLQRLHTLDAKTAAPPAPTVTGTRPTVLVRATHADHAISTQVALKLRDAGASPIILPIGVDETRERAMFARANHVIYCWGEAEEPAMFDALIASPVQGWRTENPKGQVCLVAFPPVSDMKSDALALGSFGAADLVCDGQSDDLAATLLQFLKPSA